MVGGWGREVGKGGGREVCGGDEGFSTGIKWEWKS